MPVYSRSSYIPKKLVDGVEYLDFGSAQYLNLKSQLVIQSSYLVEGIYEGFPDLISNKFYGTTDLWWIICIVNGIIDPIRDVYAGRSLDIPTLASIDAALTALTPSRVGTTVTV